MKRPDWVPDTIFYQIFPDRFRNGRPDLDPPDVVPWGAHPDRDHFHGGDLAGITQGLSHLESLGASGAYLNPIFAAGTNHRYDTHDYFTVDPRLGDVGELRELVEEAHRRGIRVILDGVFNHCGDGHPAFVDWLQHGENGNHPDWFIRFPGPQAGGESNYQTCGGAPYLPKLNTANPEVREHLLRCATYWIENADIDGWRLDVPWKIEGGFWDEFAKTMESFAPDAYIVGEVWRDASEFLDRFDGCTNYQQRSAILDYCFYDTMDGEDFMIEVGNLLSRHGQAANWMLSLVGSHDTARALTLAEGDVDRVRLAFTAMFTLPGVPMIYYGDEIGLQGGPDPDCRRAMPWDETQWDHRLLDHVQTLTRVRRERPALRRGSFRRLGERNGLAAYLREYQEDRVVVILNPRGPQHHLRLPIEGGLWRDLFSDRTYQAVAGSLVVDHVAARTALLLAEENSGR